MASPSLAASFFLLFLTLQRASGIGMNYGTMGTNLPSPKHAAAVLQHTLIDKVKIYDTNPTILQAFANTGISVAVTVENGLIQNLSTGGPPAAADWFSSQVAPFLPATPITLISVGNEVLASDSQNYDLVPAMRNIQSAVEMSGLGRRIRVSTAHSMAVLGASFPPSASTFDEKLEGVMKPLLEFLEETGAPFLVNAYPYFAYRDNPEVELEYVLFGNATGVKDPAGYEYKNMLDAQVDAVYAAMAAWGHNGTIGVTLSETGWPSAGGKGATPENARAYNEGVIARVRSRAGTPMRPERGLEAYLFALFDEDKKTGPPTERKFGLMRSDGSAAYGVDLSCQFCSQEKTRPGSGSRIGRGSGASVWCVAKPHAAEAALQEVLEFCCGEGGVDCGALYGGGACYEPNKVHAHASYAMNTYYQMHGRNYWNCDFKGIGLVTFTDPSYGVCQYPQQ